ncbi:DUF6580 family putative transport protein [Kangiella aquimarina]|uniref:DUF6580 family putative transport protein n=1 Tax=Kangiella aquimarina TaxID=261965 RepID=A0ABZ0X313_9GAMM|nr:DUF6580 family putative transport protein [Kangiella aquimarina]WQG84687.1 DUF6580 family putative transport protein [Kangiella aquimarina]
MEKISPKTLTLIAIVIAVSLYRVFPHPYNITPVMALALFAGTYFEKKWMAFAVPLFSMFLADLFLGLHNTIIFVYGAMAVAVLIGFWLQNRVSSLKVIGATIGSSLIFFLISNFGVWLVSGYYSKSWAGLIECYTMALPFLQRSMMGDLLFSGVLFLSYWQIQKYWLSAKVVQRT